MAALQRSIKSPPSAPAVPPPPPPAQRSSAAAGQAASLHILTAPSIGSSPSDISNWHNQVYKLAGWQ